MALPRPRLPMLPLSFHHASWTIKYALLTPSNPTRPTRTLIFVHGTPWSSAVFQPLATALLASNPTLRILIYDLPGYGQSRDLNVSSARSSKGFEGDTSVRAQATALAALLTHLSLDGKNENPKPAVLTHDIGGTIALRAHLLEGVDFEKMLLCDANAVLPWGAGFYSLAREEAGVFLRMPAHIWEAVVRAVVRSGSSMGFGKEWEDELVAPWLGSDGQRAFLRQAAQADDGDVGEMLDGDMYGRMRCGVKVAWGECDGWIPREKVERFSQLVGENLDGFELVEWAGHLLMLDNPEGFKAVVKSWL